VFFHYCVLSYIQLNANAGGLICCKESCPTSSLIITLFPSPMCDDIYRVLIGIFGVWGVRESGLVVG